MDVKLLNKYNNQIMFLKYVYIFDNSDRSSHASFFYQLYQYSQALPSSDLTYRKSIRFVDVQICSV